jgi:subtilisin-like proprotein convertase family protein
MDHTWIGDLTIKVVSPLGSVVTVLSRPGIAEQADNGAGGGGDSSDLNALDTLTFRDPGVTDAETMGSTIGPAAEVCFDDGLCDYFPNPGAATAGDFSTFVGEDAVGTWQVCVADSATVDLGVIDFVQLSILQ